MKLWKWESSGIYNTLDFITYIANGTLTTRYTSNIIVVGETHIIIVVVNDLDCKILDSALDSYLRPFANNKVSNV